MLKHVVCCLSVVLAVGMGATEAIAQENEPDLGGDADATEEGVEVTISESVPGPAVADSASAVLDGVVWITYPVLDVTSPIACVRTGGELVAVEAHAEVLLQRSEAFEIAYVRYIETSPAPDRCPDDTPGADPVGPLVDHVREQMPALSPAVQPPENALVGLPVYLTLGRPVRHTPEPEAVTLLTTDVVVEIDATVRTSIDWGDPHADPPVEEFTDTAGVRYEERDQPGAEPITHVYQDRADYTVTITDVWEATVTVDGLGTWVLEIPMEPYAFPLEVGELQAVITDVS